MPNQSTARSSCSTTHPLWLTSGESVHGKRRRNELVHSCGKHEESVDEEFKHAGSGRSGEQAAARRRFGRLDADRLFQYFVIAGLIGFLAAGSSKFYNAVRA